MKTLIKSVTLNNNVVTVTTNSNVVRTYTLKSNQIALNYYNELTYVNQFTNVNSEQVRNSTNNVNIT